MAIFAANLEYVIMLQKMTKVDTAVALEVGLDQREAQRHQFTQSAIVTVLGTSQPTLSAEIRNISKGGTQIRLDRPLLAGTLLKIEYDNNLLLGEVVYCKQEQDGCLLGIRVEHALFGLAALANALRGPW